MKTTTIDFVPDSPSAISDGLYAIASSLRALGNGNAMTQLGAIENLSKEVLDGSGRIADAINNLADAIRESKSI